MKDAAILLFLAAQLLWPLRALFLSRFDTRADFSWNMFSRDYRCLTAYAWAEPGGPWKELRKEELFNDPVRAAHVNHRDRLPKFHSWLCKSLGPGARLRASVRCSIDNGPWTALAEPSEELCP